MAHFFLAKTHNNLCLSLAVIQQERLKDCHIIYLNHKNRDAEFLDLFASQMQQLGITISHPYDKPVAPQKLKVLYPLLERKIYNHRIKSIVSKYRNKKIPDSYYFFDDTTLESQYVNRYLCKKDSKAFLVQHETAFYVPRIKAKKSILKMALIKSRSGLYVKDLTEIGNLRAYDAIFCLKPELLIEKYKNLTRIISIDVKYLYSVQWKNISIELFNKKFPDFFTLTKDDTLIFLPKMNRREEAKEAQVEILHRFSQKTSKLRVFIKNHSSSHFKFNSYDIRHGMDLIPDGIPEECFFSFNTERSLNYSLVSPLSFLLAKINTGKVQINVLIKNRDFINEYEYKMLNL